MITEKLWGQIRAFRKKQKIWHTPSPVALTLSNGEMGYVTFDVYYNVVCLYVGEEQLQGYLHRRARKREWEKKFHLSSEVMDDYAEDAAGLLATVGRKEQLTDAEIEQNKIWFRNAGARASGKNPYPLVREDIPHYLPMEVTDEKKLHQMEEAMDAVFFLLEQNKWSSFPKGWSELLYGEQEHYQLLHLTPRPDGSGYEVDGVPAPEMRPRAFLVPRPLTDEELAPVRGLSRIGRWDMRMYLSAATQMLSEEGDPLGPYTHGTLLGMDAEVAREEISGWIPLEDLRISDYVHHPEKMLLGLTRGFAGLGLLPQQLVIDEGDERLGAVLPAWCEALGVELVRSDHLSGLAQWDSYRENGGRDKDLSLQGIDWLDAIARTDLNGSLVLSISAEKGCYRHLQINVSSTLSDLALAIREAFALSGTVGDEVFDLEEDYMEARPAVDVQAMWGDYEGDRDLVRMESIDLDSISLGKDTSFYYDCRVAGRRYSFECRFLRWEETEVEAPKVLRRRGKLD